MLIYSLSSSTTLKQWCIHHAINVFGHSFNNHSWPCGSIRLMHRYRTLGPFYKSKHLKSMLPTILEIIIALSLFSVEKEKAIVQATFIIAHNSFWPSNILWVKIVFFILIKLLIHILWYSLLCQSWWGRARSTSSLRPD